jgi:hypothetical protein
VEVLPGKICAEILVVATRTKYSASPKRRWSSFIVVLAVFGLELLVLPLFDLLRLL